jgi:malate synthase
MNQFHDLPVERRILTAGAVAFLDDLEEEFGWRRGQLLAWRHDRQRQIESGERPDFLHETASIRSDDWEVDPGPSDLIDRRVEITGPVDAKMMINALNSGAKVFMADFEDATSPTWANILNGQANLVDAYHGNLRFEGEGKSYAIGSDPATLVVRPRGWHLEEKHFLVHGQPMSASLFDFGLYMFHGARAALETGTGPYLYLPKLESHLEARLWNEVFVWAQERLGMDRGTVRATVLIENILAAFEMDEILFELREHAAGLNAGRWDYIFSMIKKFRHDPAFILPDRAMVTMTVPFMKAYTDLLVDTCHRRGAHAIGGMSAFIPNRRDPDVTASAISAVKADKAREARSGYDGTWVAHPDLVAVARAEFGAILGGDANQIRRPRPEFSIRPDDLLDVGFDGEVTDGGVEANVSVGIRYLASWLSGVGAAAIDDLMEDVATAEISRSQIWQWVHHGVVTAQGTSVTEALVREIAGSVAGQLESSESPHLDHVALARKLFEEVALGEPFADFLTLPAYAHIN